MGIIEFIKSCINSGYYLYLKVDESIFLPKRDKPFYHELIFGYDESNETLDEQILLLPENILLRKYPFPIW